MGRWDDKDNWEGDRDVDEYAGQDWKSRILGGNYDNRYRGVKHFGHGSRRNKKRKKSIAIVIIVILIIGVFGFILFIQGYFDELIENMPQEIQDISKTVKDFTTKTTEDIPEKITDVSKIIEDEFPKISKSIDNIKVPEAPPLIANITEFFESKPTSIDESKAAIDYINQLRVDAGRNKIVFDARVYDLALARVRDTIEYDYFDHTNPITGTCPDSMKKDYGLRSNEYAAENLGSGYSSEISAINGWMGSQGHRYNLLYSTHTAGAVACEKSVCAFLGLNNDLFGSGCSVAAEGQAWHKELGKCSDAQFAQLDEMNEKYLRDLAEYEKLPQIAQSQAQYQKGMKMYNDLNRQLTAIENFRC